MFKRFLFQTHWLVGITAGTVLAIVGLTGSVLSFESNLQHWLNRDVRTVVPTADVPLSPAALLSELYRQHPDKRVSELTFSSDANESVRITYAAPDGGPAAAAGRRGPRGEIRYANPYTGELLAGDGTRGQAFFRTTRSIHRWLTAGTWGDQQIGRQIVGASTLLCIVLALSGLYLRWPRRLGDWRSWLTFDLSLTGRSFLWHAHAVLGTWALFGLLMMSLTGLYWSYDWYRGGLYALAGVEQAAPRSAPSPTPSNRAANRSLPPHIRNTPPPGIQLDTVWSRFTQDVSALGFSTATLSLPRQATQPIEIRYANAQPAHERAWNTMSLNASTGAIIRHERYAEKPVGAKFMASIFPLHSGSFFGLAGVLAYMLASLCMPVFALTGWLMYLGRRKKAQAAKAARIRADVHNPKGPPASPDATVLLAFASQTGGSRELSWRTAGTLRAAGIPVEVRALGHIGADDLRQARQALFVVSTFGDGEPPDEAQTFARHVMRHNTSLSGLCYGVLALGDRRYKTFCGFGHALDQWLRDQGAQPYFTPVEVDNSDPQALSHWLERLGNTVAAGAALGTWAPVVHQEWRLARRTLLNLESIGGPTFHIELTAATPGLMPIWKAGDIAEIQIAPPQTPGEASTVPTPPVREFSIASLPEDGGLHLLVRQVRKDEATLGLGSGWLTSSIAPGDTLHVRIRSNPGFHSPEDDRPIVLLGNGTGIAGLRSHIKARVLADQRRNWLIFGERSRAHDFYYEKEISNWQSEGWLQRVDLAFSRDQPERHYIHHILRRQAETLQTWVDEGAALYVCGSAEGMAQDVHRALNDLLGESAVARLAEDGRYRRDVY